jgi:hypothetical protein
MDEDADRDPETKGEIRQRWEEKGKISNGYTEARSKLPDSPADDPWGYSELPTRNPAKNITPPLWEVLKSEVYRVHRRAEQGRMSNPPETPEHRLAEAIGRVQLRPYYWSKGTNEELTQNLDGEEATRLYLFFDLSPFTQTDVARAIKKPAFRESLGIEQSVSQPTLNGPRSNAPVEHVQRPE